MYYLYNDNADEIKFNLIRNYNKCKRDIYTGAFVHGARSVIESVSDSIVQFVSSHMDYETPINSSIENLMTIDNNEELLNFYENLADSFNLAEKPISICLKNTDAITRIRPQYLVAFRRELDVLYRKFILGLDLSNKEIKIKLDKLTTKYKFSTVKCNINTDVLNGVTSITPQVYLVNNDFIGNTICQFTRNYEVVRSQLISEATEARTAITELAAASERMAQSATPEGLTDGEKRSLDYFIIYSTKCTCDLLSYVTAMIVERLSAYTYNMNAYYKLYNTIHNYYPEGERLLHENCIDNELNELDDFKLVDCMIQNDISFISPAVKQALDKIQFEIDHMTNYSNNTAIVDSIMGTDLDSMDYDKNPYDQCMELFKIYNNSLQVMYKSSLDPNMSVDEITDKAGVNDDFSAKFKTVVALIPDTKVYTTAVDDGESPLLVLSMIRQELSQYENNLTVIATACQDVYRNIRNMESEYEENPDGKFGQPEQAEELCDIAQNHEQNIRDIGTNVIKAFVERLKNLKACLESLNVVQEMVELPIITQEDNVSYIEEAYNSILEEDEFFQESAFKSLLRQYNVYKNKAERGVIILYEADDANNNTTNNSDNNANNDNASNKEAMSGAWAKFKQFVKNIIGKFKKKAKDIQASGKIDYITKNYDAIIEKVTSDVECNVQPYYPALNPNVYDTDIKALENAIKNLDDTDIKNASSAEALREKIFGFIKTKSVGDFSIQKDFKQFCLTYYSSGENQNDYNEGRSVSGDDLQSAIRQELDFCKEYFATANNIGNACNRIMKSMDQKLEAMKIVDSAQVQQAENEEQNKKAEDNKNNQQEQNQNNNQPNDQNKSNTNSNNNNNTSNQSNNNNNSSNNNANNQNNNSNNNNQSNNNNSNNTQNTNESAYQPILRGAVIYEEVVKEVNSNNNNNTSNQSNNNNSSNNNANNQNNNSNNNNQSNNKSMEEKIGWITADCRIFETSMMSAVEKRFYADSKLFYNIIQGNVDKKKNDNDNNDNNGQSDENNNDSSNNNDENSNNDNNNDNQNNE